MIEEGNYPRTPLTIVRALPPDLEVAIRNSRNWAGTDDGHYTVRLELSRDATQLEISFIHQIDPTMRIYGNILELRDTTLEKVAASTHELSNRVADIEAHAKKVQADLDELHTAHRTVDAQTAAEQQRLRTLAEAITFDRH